MTIPTPSDPAAVAVELEKLRGTMETGFARVDGSLALLVQRGDQTDRAIADHESRLDALERGRWPLPSLAALVALVGLVLSVWQFAARP
ncbi:hypothetical protein SEA_PICARD_23 [Streptomyces phage Picard]|uniref:Uncharacterized protein n=2 Tax=Picardvirus picard TaxID=2734264 RepID=A0A1J0MC07_9CAUD|nr:hypothetical protein HOR45_gp23 [Streptomyces phage Picard]APD18553.1 hypothetical protein SEA_PICARD_23 [Streptomyces phage Picard]APD18664.1 hypothetical protein SEA_MOJORITA_23 [Streptomyces phage Mojorita]